MGTQKDLVLSAVGSNAATSADIAMLTGLRADICSHWLCELEADGVLRSIGLRERFKVYILADNNADFSELTAQLNDAENQRKRRLDYMRYASTVKKYVRGILGMVKE